MLTDNKSPEGLDTYSAGLSRCLSWFIIGCLLAIGVIASPKAYGQPYWMADVSLGFETGQFNLESLSPAPTATGQGQVFANGWSGILTIKIRQWDNGTISVIAPTRTQDTTGAVTTTAPYSGPTIAPGTTFQSGGTSTSTGTAITTSASVVNSLSFQLEGNVLIAHVEYTENGTKYAYNIPLGEVTVLGGFSAFATGFLSGKSIISGSPQSAFPGEGRPAKLNGRRGITDSGYPTYAHVVTGYYVTIMSQNGQIISMNAEPVYGWFLTGFKHIANPYRMPSGGEER